MNTEGKCNNEIFTKFVLFFFKNQIFKNLKSGRILQFYCFSGSFKNIDIIQIYFSPNGRGNGNILLLLKLLKLTTNWFSYVRLMTYQCKNFTSFNFLILKYKNFKKPIKTKTHKLIKLIKKPIFILNLIKNCKIIKNTKFRSIKRLIIYHKIYDY